MILKSKKLINTNYSRCIRRRVFIFDANPKLLLSAISLKKILIFSTDCINLLNYNIFLSSINSFKLSVVSNTTHFLIYFIILVSFLGLLSHNFSINFYNIFK